MKTKEERAAYNKEYRKNNREKIASISRAYRGRNKDKVNSKNRAWREVNREKQVAHTKVANAIRGGRLARLPCSECGETKVEAHHVDYDKPLDVIWLCKSHHAQLHREHKMYE